MRTQNQSALPAVGDTVRVEHDVHGVIEGEVTWIDDKHIVIQADPTRYSLLIETLTFT